MAKAFSSITHSRNRRQSEVVSTLDGKAQNVPVSVIVLSFNSEEDIAACLESVRGWAAEVFVVDAFSTDATVALSEQAGAQVFRHQFEGFAQQRSWAMYNLPVANEWLLHLDADERLTPELRDEIARVVMDSEQRHDAYNVGRRFIWLGRWLRHGGYYPNPEVRLLRCGCCRVIDAGLREYVAVQGSIGTLRNDMIHESHKGLAWWTAKHNNYSNHEATEVLTRAGLAALKTAESTESVEGSLRRSLRQHVFYRCPVYVRPWLLFLYRYVLRCGFLDGTAGLSYCFLHDLWYPFLVDAKYDEMRRRRG